ncbi:MAG: hypothetical protein DRP01_08875 [Archaeoglobales archaeon]|nr:MAG: hypothetical protein DRP01_08875 [Archaeoglobales archaeon]
MVKLDIGSGRRARGDVGIDIDFEWSNPNYDPTPYDPICGSPHPHPDLVMADANFPLPFRDNAFEEVTIVHVLEHLDNPIQVLEEVKRVLKPCGKVKIVVPNARINPADWLEEGHLYSWTRPTIERLVSKVLRVLHVAYLSDGLDLYVLAGKDEDTDNGCNWVHRVKPSEAPPTTRFRGDMWAYEVYIHNKARTRRRPNLPRRPNRLLQRRKSHKNRKT